MSFGLSLFEQCVARPVVYQLGNWTPIDSGNIGNTQATEVTLVADQFFVSGVELAPPPDFEGGLDELVNQFEANVAAFSCTFSISQGSGGVLYETKPSDTIGNRTKGRPRVYSTTPTGVLVAFVTQLNLASQFFGVPLVLKVTMNLALDQGKPFNQRLVTDPTEMNIRLLIDKNRFRPQAVPCRSVQQLIRVIHPVVIESFVRELGHSVQSVLSVTVRNTSSMHAIGIHGLVFDFPRTSPSLLGSFDTFVEFESINATPLRAQQHKKDNGSNHDTAGTNGYNNEQQKPLLPLLSIRPQEEYTLLYNLKAKPNFHRIAGPSLGNNQIFSTPCTLYWSIVQSPNGLSKCNGHEAHGEVIQSKHQNDIDMDHILNSLIVEGIRANGGIGFTSDPAAGCCVSEVHHNINWSIRTHSSSSSSSSSVEIQQCATPLLYPLDIKMEGPRQVYINEMFEIRVCVSNHSPVHMERLSLLTNATDPFSPNEYVSMEPRIPLRDLPPGSSTACLLHITPMRMGTLSITDLAVVCYESPHHNNHTHTNNGTTMFQLRDPFEILVIDNLEVVEL